MNRTTAEAAVRRALWRVRQPSRRAMKDRLRNFAEQGYRGEDLLRRAAGLPLVRECPHEDQPGPYCGLCGGPCPPQPAGGRAAEGVGTVSDVSIMEDSLEGALQRNDALRVLGLALASNGYDLSWWVVGAILRDIEEGGYALRLTTHDERLAKNSEHGPSS